MAAPLRHPDHAKLQLFKTPNGKSQNWYAGFHHGGKFHRRSLKTEVWADALAAAENWYDEVRYELKRGVYIPPRAASGPTFSSIIERTLNGMTAQGKSSHYVRTTRTYLGQTGYVRRFFGPQRLKEITTRSWDDFRLWLTDERTTEGKAVHSERTIHQMKNVVQLVLGQAYVDKLIDLVPKFEDRLRSKKKDNRPRVFFDRTEYARLLMFARRNIKKHVADKTRWVDEAQELYEYIVFMVNTGLRVGECRALRFKDVRIKKAPVLIKGISKEREVCEITITAGKMGAHPTCVSYLTAPAVFRRIVARRDIEKPETSDQLIFRAHHREAFKRLLRDHGLYKDNYRTTYHPWVADGDRERENQRTHGMRDMRPMLSLP